MGFQPINSSFIAPATLISSSPLTGYKNIQLIIYFYPINPYLQSHSYITYCFTCLFLPSEKEGQIDFTSQASPTQLRVARFLL